MKYRLPIIVSVSVVVIILTIILIPSFDSQEIEKNHIIKAEFVPSVYDGVNRDYPETVILTDKDFQDVPKIKTMLNHAFDVPVPIGRDAPIRAGITIVDDSDKYYLIQTGPFSIKIETYMSDEEFNKTQLWIDENLIEIPIYDEVSRYYVEYNHEVFVFTLDPLQN